MTRPIQPVPAQLTAIRSDVPAAAWSTARWQCSGSVTSPATYSPPTSSATLRAPSSFRSKTVTRTPSAERARAVAAPSPEAPPVTIAEDPWSSMTGDGRGVAAGPANAPAGESRRARPPGLCRRGGGRQLVDDVVPAVTRMTLHPLEPHGGASVQRELKQRLPQVPVGDRLALGVAPSSPAPSDPPPLEEAVHHVGRVPAHEHAVGPCLGKEGLQGAQHGRHLHPLVGRRRCGAALEPAAGDDPRPTAPPGVPEAGSVGVDDRGGHRRRSTTAPRRTRRAVPWTPCSSTASPTRSPTSTRRRRPSGWTPSTRWSAPTGDRGHGSS